MAKYRVIFDLDGTLIDSSSSILSSLKTALHNASLSPIHPLGYNLIGPPLTQIISGILAPQHHSRIPEVIEFFKLHYDNHGYLGTTVYPGVIDVLVQLKQKNMEMYIATNKRITPTLKILNQFGLVEFFKDVYSLDCFKPSASNKSTMLSNIKNILNPPHSDFIYVGDRIEDAQAAYENKIHFYLASWGYGDAFEFINNQCILKSPSDLLRLIQA